MELKDVSKKYSQRKRGAANKISGKVYSQNNMRPYPNLPSPTVAASFQSNFIHPYLNRNFTAREAARIQSFPDWFEFRSKETTGGSSRSFEVPQYTQVGNAVPPLLALELGKSIKVENVPEIYLRGQGGLLDLELHPNFANNNLIYISMRILTLISPSS